jgi:hypothetical protein
MKFKTEKARLGFSKMHPTAQRIAMLMEIWARDRGVELFVTETFTTEAEDKALKRQSDTHRTGRAFDIRTKDLTPEFIEDFLEYFMTLYNKKYGAVGKDGPCLIVYRPHGSGPHFHVQIRRGLPEGGTDA